MQNDRTQGVALHSSNTVNYTFKSLAFYFEHYLALIHSKLPVILLIVLPVRSGRTRRRNTSKAELCHASSIKVQIGSMFANYLGRTGRWDLEGLKIKVSEIAGKASATRMAD